jgi:hypothetical protein
MQSSWLNLVPWESILTLNQELCAAQKIEPATKPAALEQARQSWEEARRRGASLVEALDVCRACHALNALVYHNGNTFAAISRRLLEEPLKSLPPVEAQIIRTTVSHYTVGWIGRRELLSILGHYEAAWQKPARKAEGTAAAPMTLRPATEGR